MSRSRVALLLGALVLSSLTTPAATAAATYTSTGLRCTVVGTGADDQLRGTDRRDVICGLGGDDTIRSLGGNDVVEGGGGDDTLLSGGGADTLSGGRGRDTLAAGPGTDVLTGGPGGDTLLGGGGGDGLEGNGGNDDLTGGTGADELDGNAGTNWCTVDAADSGVRCVHDLAAPVVVDGEFGVARVDVTDKDGSVAVRGHVTDDTGLSDVRLVASDGTETYVVHAFLTSGTVRDGWWEGSFGVPRWSAPGTLTLSVEAVDRVGRRTGRTFPEAVVEVVDRDPDLDQPEVELLAPTPDTLYDVRETGADVEVRARITDAVSGVRRALVCVHKPRDGYWTNLPCEHASVVSGDERDGVWRGVVRIPRRETSGRWNVSIIVTDMAHSDEERWVGPDIYAVDADAGYGPGWTRPFPSGMGAFMVTGAGDVHPPELMAFTMSPTEVSTLAGSARVRFGVSARDAEGVTSVGAALYPLDPESQVHLGWSDLALTSGTFTDGTWTGGLLVPQGTPPGRYGVQVWVEDVVHWRSWFTPGTADPGYEGAMDLPAEAVLTVRPD